MKIALVSYEFPSETETGGIGTYTHQLALLLAGAGFSVHVFAGSHVKSSSRQFGNLIVHRVLCEGPQQFQDRVVPVFSEQHLANAFDIVESAEINGNGLKIKLKFRDLPLHVRLHACNYLVESLKKKYLPFSAKLRFFLGALRRGRFDLGYWRKYEYKNDPEYLFVRQANYISAPSEQMKNWAVSNWRLDPGKIHVVGNPFAGNARLKLARTVNQERAILFYGRLNVLKGLMTATTAMKKVLAANPSWTWVIAGEDGPAADGKRSMRNWMEEQLLPVRKQVSFLGSVPYEQVPSLLKECSIVIVPSLFESFSYVTLEALYAGKAVVGSRATGIESLIQDHANGLLADPFRATAWIKSLQKLIDDPLLRRNLGGEATKSAEEREEMNNRIVAWYQSLVNTSIVQPCE